MCSDDMGFVNTGLQHTSCIDLFPFYACQSTYLPSRVSAKLDQRSIRSTDPRQVLDSVQGRSPTSEPNVGIDPPSLSPQYLDRLTARPTKSMYEYGSSSGTSQMARALHPC